MVIIVFCPLSLFPTLGIIVLTLLGMYTGSAVNRNAVTGALKDANIVSPYRVTAACYLGCVMLAADNDFNITCLLYTSPSPRDA